MAHKKGASSSRNGRDSECPAARREAFRRPASSTRARSSSASAARTSTPATASAAAAMTRCSRWSAGREVRQASAAAGLSASSPAEPQEQSGSPAARAYNSEGGPGYLARPCVSCGSQQTREAGRRTVAEFADQVTLRVQAGDGGNGCASIHREKFKPLGGPDGGNGGRGGDVILEVDASSATLLDFHRRPVRRAGNGQQGAGSNRTGADGADLVVRVPNGTVVKTADGEVLADLIGVGTRFVAAARAAGAASATRRSRSPRRKAPGFALRGEPGRAARPHPRAEDGGRRRAGRLPQRGQVLADRGHVRGPAEDRRLPVHHA